MGTLPKPQRPKVEEWKCYCSKCLRLKSAFTLQLLPPRRLACNPTTYASRQTPTIPSLFHLLAHEDNFNRPPDRTLLQHCPYDGLGGFIALSDKAHHAFPTKPFPSTSVHASSCITQTSPRDILQQVDFRQRISLWSNESGHLTRLCRPNPKASQLRPFLCPWIRLVRLSTHQAGLALLRATYERKWLTGTRQGNRSSRRIWHISPSQRDHTAHENSHALRQVRRLVRPKCTSQTRPGHGLSQSSY